MYMESEVRYWFDGKSIVIDIIFIGAQPVSAVLTVCSICYIQYTALCFGSGTVIFCPIPGTEMGKVKCCSATHRKPCMFMNEYKVFSDRLRWRL